jgi:magnesium transporter
MQSLVKKQSAKYGLPPGTLIHVGAEPAVKTQIRTVVYDSDRLDEYEFANAADCRRLAELPGTTWIDVDGVNDVGLIAELGKAFELHPLVLEDIVNTNQRPKIQDYSEYLFLVFRMLVYDEKKDEIHSDQISIILGEGYVLSFSEQIGDEFKSVRDQARDPSSRLRTRGTEYLTYRLFDSVVDGYFQILEHLGSRIERLENRILKNRAGDFLPELHNIKRELLFIRAGIGPLRMMMDDLYASRSPLLGGDIRHYWDDLRDHILNAIEMIETLRDMGAGNLEIYLSSIQFRQNDVIRVLTIIATVFLPLTFLVGVWGMNFEHMPEISWKWGYGFAWGIMLVISGAMFIWFRRKKWM